MRKDGNKPSYAFSCIQRNVKSTNTRAESGLLVANNYAVICTREKGSC